jgi:hypothetical protein
LEGIVDTSVIVTVAELWGKNKNAARSKSYLFPLAVHGNPFDCIECVEMSRSGSVATKGVKQVLHGERLSSLHYTCCLSKVLAF